MEHQAKDFQDYLNAFRRRWLPAAIISGVIFICGTAIALLWPATFQSTATILIEEQDIPTELVRSTVTSYASQRIQTISQRVMTRANLTKIMDEHGLYLDRRKKDTIEELVSRMREAIKLDMISADVIDPQTGRPSTATIAFTLSFEGENPGKVQKVASELTSLYLNENLRTRTESASETLDFLTKESERLGDHISDIENRLATFKEQYADRLPELQQLNAQLLNRAEIELENTDQQIRTLKEHITLINAQLAITPPYNTGTTEGGQQNMGPEQRLKALQSNYRELIANYSADHPDVLRLKREISALETETGLAPEDPAKQQELAQLKSELESLQGRYSDTHPDIQRLKRQIALLEEELSAPRQSTSAVVENPDNPTYVSMQVQLQAAQNNLEVLRANRVKLEERLKSIEQRLMEMPQVERAYLQMSRELANSISKYQEIKAKQLQAEVGQQLEEERKGEKLLLIDPAALPEKPISPNRPAIIFLGLVLAIGGGFGFIAVGETMDTTIRGAKGIISAIQMSPLAVIPYRTDKQETRHRHHKKIYIILAIAALTLLAILLIHFLWTPLDVFWFRLMRKADRTLGL